MLVAVALISTQCTDEKKEDTSATSEVKPMVAQFGGFDSQVKWGERLVTICGCNDCHTPKKMGPKGPENDMQNSTRKDPVLICFLFNIVLSF